MMQRSGAEDETQKVTSEHSPLPESQLELFCEVAEENGASMSLKEILLLTSLDLTEEELKALWSTSKILNQKYEISSSGVIRRTSAIQDDGREQQERYARAIENINHASRLGAICRDKAIKVLSVSGSTSYYSVSREDDLDFFCIAKSGRMWSFLTRSLILARALRMFRRDSPSLCFSYVMDENYARRQFLGPKDGLFARDALSTVVISGKDYYNDLLQQSRWMQDYFPKLYKLRLSKKTAESGEVRKSKSFTSIDRISNLFLYLSSGSYIRLKSFLLNRKLSKWGDTSRLFHVRMGEDHIIYESASYLRLRGMYSRMKDNGKRKTVTDVLQS